MKTCKKKLLSPPLILDQPDICISLNKILCQKYLQHSDSVGVNLFDTLPSETKPSQITIINQPLKFQYLCIYGS